jgi:hypothetical protein
MKCKNCGREIGEMMDSDTMAEVFADETKKPATFKSGAKCDHCELYYEVVWEAKTIKTFSLKSAEAVKVET